MLTASVAATIFLQCAKNFSNHLLIWPLQPPMGKYSYYAHFICDKVESQWRANLYKVAWSVMVHHDLISSNWIWDIAHYAAMPHRENIWATQLLSFKNQLLKNHVVCLRVDILGICWEN